MITSAELSYTAGSSETCSILYETDKQYEKQMIGRLIMIGVGNALLLSVIYRGTICGIFRCTKYGNFYSDPL